MDGGVRIDSGIDVNGNGVLDSGEITDTAFVCSGESGSNGCSLANNTSNIALLHVLLTYLIIIPGLVYLRRRRRKY